MPVGIQVDHIRRERAFQLEQPAAALLHVRPGIVHPFQLEAAGSQAEIGDRPASARCAGSARRPSPPATPRFRAAPRPGASSSAKVHTPPTVSPVIRTRLTSPSGMPGILRLQLHQRRGTLLLNVAELVETRRGRVRGRAPRPGRPARPSGACNRASRGMGTAARACWPTRRATAGARATPPRRPGRRPGNRADWPAQRERVRLAWISRSPISAVEILHFLSSSSRPASVMLSTPASTETQPARPSRSIMSGLHRSMRV